MPESPDSEDRPPQDAIREELTRVLRSAPFAAAARSRRFLAYVVEETLAGRSDGIKELVLGTAVFDRAPDFDPRIDTIVRVEAGKLRKRLDDCYGAASSPFGVRIDVPKGSYVPTFTRQEEASTEAVAASGASGAEPPSGDAIAARQLRRRLTWAAASLVVLSAAVWFGTRPREASRVVRDPSIAVLAFENFSPDPANEYLADGLSEDLTDALSRRGDLRVAARTSAFALKGQKVDVRDIGVRLHVAFVLEGSVRRDGDTLKVTAQLVRTDDGYHVWSRSFERSMQDVLAVQEEVARTVVESVARVATGRQLPPTHRPTARAFDLYLQGLHSSSFTNLDQVERLLLASAADDPRYAKPHVALARAYLMADITGVRPTRELVARAREQIRTALALDEFSAEAHAALGNILARHEYRWDEAEREMRRSLELDPRAAQTHSDLAQNILAPQERWDEAVAETQRAQELDPLSETLEANKAFLLYLRRDHQAAIDAFRELVARNGDDLSSTGLVVALMGAGHVDEGLAVLERAGPLAKTPSMMGFLAHGYSRAGRPAEALRVRRELEAMARQRFVSAAVFAHIDAGLNRPEDAVRELEAARAEQSSGLIFLRVGGEFDALRSSPGFARLLEEVGLSDDHLASRRVAPR